MPACLKVGHFASGQGMDPFFLWWQRAPGHPSGNLPLGKALESVCTTAKWMEKPLSGLWHLPHPFWFAGFPTENGQPKKRASLALPPQSSHPITGPWFCSDLGF